MSTRREAPALKSLMRHALIQIQIRASLFEENLRGWRRFARWVPRLVSSALRGDLGHGQGSGEALTSSFVADLKSLPAFYINLDSRPDRNLQTLEEFRRMGLRTPIRFAAASNPNGGLGCSMSHRDLVQMLIATGSGLTMICEDDVEFIAHPQAFSNVILEFQERRNLGVLCLAYRVRGPRLRISSSLSISNNIQTAACYVVKPFALRPLRQSFQTSVSKLEQGAAWATFANDQLWKQVQTDEIFFSIPHTPMARQRESYSDIAMKRKFYR